MALGFMLGIGTGRRRKEEDGGRREKKGAAARTGCCGPTMDISSSDGLPAERFRGTGIQGDIGFGKGLEHTRGIGGAVLQRRVSMHGANAEEVQVGMVGGKEDGEDVLSGEKKVSGMEGKGCFGGGTHIVP